MSEVPSANNPSTSTPSPTPPAPEKQALIIAKSFIKTYYHTLSTKPSEIYKFYKAKSQLSFSQECNTDSELVTLSDTKDGKHAKFLEKFQNATINFQNGSIDAQMSANGGIFLVVTGYMTLQGDSYEQRFVHSFFLSNEKQGAKKHFFVLNDVFRFLTEVKEEEEQAEAVVEEHVEEVVVEEEIEVVIAVEKTVDGEDGSLNEAAQAAVSEEEESVEESPPAYHEEVAAEEEATPETTQPVSEEELLMEELVTSLPEEAVKEDPIAQPNSSSADTALFPSPVTTQKPKPPGSWASLVAGGKAQPEEKVKPVPIAIKKEAPSTASSEAGSELLVPSTREDAVRSTRPRSSNMGGSRSTRQYSSYSDTKPSEPSSLYIKNIGDDLKETDLRALFATYGHKIVNVNLYPTRGFAFVDFSDSAAVTDIMKEPRSFIVNGRPLDVEKKTGERRSSSSSHSRGGNGMSVGRGGRGSGGPPSSSARRSSPRGDSRDTGRSTSTTAGRLDASATDSRTRSNSGGQRRRGRGGAGGRG